MESHSLLYGKPNLFFIFHLYNNLTSDHILGHKESHAMDATVVTLMEDQHVNPMAVTDPTRPELTQRG